MTHRTEFSSFLFRVAAALAALLLLAFATPAFAGSTFERSEYGAFTVETEKYKHEGAPLLHALSNWTKVRLIWRSSEARVSVVDEGWQVTLESVILPGEPQKSCLSTAGPMGGIDAPPSNDAFWRLAINSIRQLLGSCTSATKEQKAAVLADMATAARHYPPAADAWKAASVKAFGTIEGRCVRTELAWDGPGCAQWSGEQMDRAKLAALRKRCGIGKHVLTFKSNLLLEWRVKENEWPDEGLMRCAHEQLRPFKGVYIRTHSVKAGKG